MTPSSHFMSGMEQRVVRAGEIRINCWLGGTGAPVVLLHGYPQTGQMWRKVAPKLTDEFSIVCPDLRGYGDSDKPRVVGPIAANSSRRWSSSATVSG